MPHIINSSSHYVDVLVLKGVGDIVLHFTKQGENIKCTARWNYYSRQQKELASVPPAIFKRARAVAVKRFKSKVNNTPRQGVLDL